jgi:hypothetical protein
MLMKCLPRANFQPVGTADMQERVPAGTVLPNGIVEFFSFVDGVWNREQKIRRSGKGPADGP